MTKQTAEDFTRKMQGQFGFVLRDKPEAKEMQVLAQVLGAVDFVSRLGSLDLDVPSATDFLQKFWTTIGPVVYPAGGSSTEDYEDWIISLTRELGHKVQFDSDPAHFFYNWARYSEKRVSYEVEAEAGKLEVRWYLTGTLPVLEDLVVDRGYNLTEAEIEMSRNMLEAVATRISKGILATKAGMTACRTLRGMGVRPVGKIITT